MRTHPDDRIIQLLMQGYHEKEIPFFLSRDGYWPKSLSYVEKFLKRLKERHGVKTMFSLGLIYGQKTTTKQELAVFDRAREIVAKDYNRITVKSSGKDYEAKKSPDGLTIIITKEALKQ